MSKRLGQHFLKDKNKIRKIIESLNIKRGDVIVEIGPGKGALTKELLKNEIEYIGIEKDEKLAEFIRDNLGEEVIIADALEILSTLPKKLGLEEYKLIGNIPYYITGRLFRTLGEMKDKPMIIVLTIQKEVAERLTASPPNMNKLGASVQVWGKPKIIENIPKECFSPMPKVNSSVIKIVPKEDNINEDYYKTMRIIFRHPRKTLLNNLDAGLKKEKLKISKIIKKINLDPKIRPERLTVKQIKNISESINKNE